MATIEKERDLEEDISEVFDDEEIVEESDEKEEKPFAFARLRYQRDYCCLRYSGFVLVALFAPVCNDR